VFEINTGPSAEDKTMSILYIGKRENTNGDRDCCGSQSFSNKVVNTLSLLRKSKPNKYVQKESSKQHRRLSPREGKNLLGLAGANDQNKGPI
jgi:hypothetical protein